MLEEDVRNEVGERAWSLLTTGEQTKILAGSGSSLSLAGMQVFELLWKRFKPTYRLGKLYQAESDRYQEYYKIYCKYARELGAGRINQDDISGTTVSVERTDLYQWRNLLL